MSAVRKQSRASWEQRPSGRVMDATPKLATAAALRRQRHAWDSLGRRGAIAQKFAGRFSGRPDDP